MSVLTQKGKNRVWIDHHYIYRIVVKRKGEVLATVSPTDRHVVLKNVEM